MGGLEFLAKKSESKLTKHRILRSSAELRNVLPHTRSFSRRNFVAFIGRYSKVIAKPVSGSGGAGVLMITQVKKETYQVHRGAKRKTIRGKKGAYRYVRRKLGTRYLLQRRISLAQVGGRPFDVRVMVQRRPGSSWVVTGMLAKVAGRGYIITNIKRSGGYVLPLSTAIQRSNIRASSPSVIARLRRIALLAARRLSGYYSSQLVFGFDMGIDAKGKVWIIEANLRPDITLFAKLRDKQMYRTILTFRR